MCDEMYFNRTNYLRRWAVLVNLIAGHVKLKQDHHKDEPVRWAFIRCLGGERSQGVHHGRDRPDQK